MALKSRSTYIILVVALIFAAFFSIMMYYSPTGTISNVEDISVTKFSSEEVETSDNTFLEYCENILCSDFIVLFVSVFACLTALREYSDDFIKSIWNDIPKKQYSFFAKVLLVLLYALVLLLCCFLIILLLNAVIFKTKLGDPAPFFKVFAIQILMELVMGALVISVSKLMKKPIVAVIVTIVYIALAYQLLSGFINLIADKAFHAGAFDCKGYTVYGNIMKINAESGCGDITRALIVTVVFAVIAVVLGIREYRRDFE